jgi:tRNA A-37 threonylcarbamoyl transferase component Bud32
MNPYTSRTMIKDPSAFVGRAAELHDVFTLLAAMQSCSIVGPRRIGKSSLLYHLTHPSAYQSQITNYANYIFAFVDLQELTGLGPEDFFYTAVERLARASGGRLEANPERDGTQAGFRRFLGRVSDDGWRLALCCDEFEMLSTNPRFTADFFAYLRGLCSNYNLALVTSSQASLFDLCHQGNLQTSQFWNIFVERTLGAMPDDEARALIVEPFARAGHSLADNDVTRILDLAGRHPFFIQIACYHLFELGAAEQETLPNRFFEEARRHYAYEWERLDSAGQALLMALARGEAPTLDPALFQQLKRNAIVSGGLESLSLISDGWRRFVEERASGVPITTQPPARTGSTPGERKSGVWSGRRLGVYEVLEALGRGGMAEVYKGRHTRLDKTVAIKVLPLEVADDPNFRARFEREARAVAALKHPNIVQVFDFGDVDGTYYMVMDYIAGKDLAHLMRETGPLPLARVGPLARDIANALDYAHAQGLVHRDVKPSNVMIEAGPTPRAVLMDFGIAKILSGGNTGPTRSGMIGTLDYMAPEQINASATIDGRADVYSLGVMVYQMLTGQLPFTGESPGAVLMAHLQQPAPDPRAVRPNLPAACAEAIQRALAKDPAQRCPTAGELAGTLE